MQNEGQPRTPQICRSEAAAVLPVGDVQSFVPQVGQTSGDRCASNCTVDASGDARRRMHRKGRADPVSVLAASLIKMGPVSEPEAQTDRRIDVDVTTGLVAVGEAAIDFGEHRAGIDVEFMGEPEAVIDQAGNRVHIA
jgi:hypothetical protein